MFSISLQNNSILFAHNYNEFVIILYYGFNIYNV